MKNLLLIVLCTTLLLNSCSSGGDVPNPIPPAPSLSIGDYYQGGVIFYLDTFGGGLIADISDLGIASWGCYGLIVGTQSGIGTGFENTQNIINANCQNINNTAAGMCYNSNRGGYSDWFLPSIYELYAMWDYYLLIDSVSVLYGGDVFVSTLPNSQGSPNTCYYSSTESDYVPSNNALSHFVLLKSPTLDYYKSAGHNVRAIRAFSND